MPLDSQSLNYYQHYFPQIAKTAYIAPSAIVIGRVSIGHNCSVWPSSVIRGDVNYIQIGHNTNIQDGSILHNTHPGIYTQNGCPLIIGSNTTVGHKAMLHGCSIGDHVLIGMNSTVLDDAMIEDYVILGAHSLVKTNSVLASGFLYAGSPATQKRKLTDQEKAFLDYSAQNYVRLKNDYQAG